MERSRRSDIRCSCSPLTRAGEMTWRHLLRPPIALAPAQNQETNSKCAELVETQARRCILFAPEEGAIRGPSRSRSARRRARCEAIRLLEGLDIYFPTKFRAGRSAVHGGGAQGDDAHRRAGLTSRRAAASPAADRLVKPTLRRGIPSGRISAARLVPHEYERPDAAFCTCREAR